jgi:hypothetical protein
VTLSLPDPSFITLLEPEYVYGFLLAHKSHPTRVPLRRMSTRLLRLKRPVSLHSIGLLPTYPPGHSCPQPRIFRLNEISFFICRRCFKAPRCHKSTQFSTQLTSTSARGNSSARYQTDASNSSPGFASHLSGRKSLGPAQVLGFWCDANVLAWIRMPAIGRLTRPSIVIEKPGST